MYIITIVITRYGLGIQIVKVQYLIFTILLCSLVVEDS